MKKIMILVSLSALVFMGFQINPFHEQGAKNNKNARMIEGLKLTEDQKKQYNSIRFEMEEKQIDIQSQFKKNRLSIKKLIANEDVEKEDLFNLIDKGSELRSKLAKIKTEFWFEIKKILNKDQQELWIKYLNRIVILQDEMRSKGKHKMKKETKRRGMERERRSKREFKGMNN